jgi:hypothetical protein
MLGHQLHTQAHHHVHVTKIIQAMTMPTARSRHRSTWPVAVHYIYMQLLALTQDHNICPHRITTSAHTGSQHLPTQDHNICLTRMSLWTDSTNHTCVTGKEHAEHCTATGGVSGRTPPLCQPACMHACMLSTVSNQATPSTSRDTMQGRVSQFAGDRA